MCGIFGSLLRQLCGYSQDLLPDRKQVREVCGPEEETVWIKRLFRDMIVMPADEKQISSQKQAKHTIRS